jgi:hypothetical protein
MEKTGRTATTGTSRGRAEDEMDDLAFESFRTELLALLNQPMELGDGDPGPIRLADEIVALLARYDVDLRA